MVFPRLSNGKPVEWEERLESREKEGHRWKTTFQLASIPRKGPLLTHTLNTLTHVRSPSRFTFGEGSTYSYNPQFIKYVIYANFSSKIQYLVHENSVSSFCQGIRNSNIG